MLKINQTHAIWILAMLGFILFLGTGCSSAPEEASNSRTIQDVRGDSDRFFQKMGEEEKKK